MANNITPNNQIVYITDNDDFFNLNTSDSRIVNSEKFNQLFHIYGSNSILYGLKIKNFNYDEKKYILNLTISSGALILDNILFEIQEDFTKSINLKQNTFNDNSLIILTTNYDYIVKPQYKALISFSLLNMDYDITTNNCNYALPTDFDTNKNNVVIHMLYYDYYKNEVVNITPKYSHEKYIFIKVRLRGMSEIRTIGTLEFDVYSKCN